MSKHNNNPYNAPQSDFKGSTSDFKGGDDILPSEEENAIEPIQEVLGTVRPHITPPKTEILDIFGQEEQEEVKHYDIKRNGIELQKTDIPYVYSRTDGRGFVCRIYSSIPKIDTWVMTDPETKGKDKNGKAIKGTPFLTKKKAAEYLFKQQEFIASDPTYKNKNITFGKVWEMFLNSAHGRANETIRRYNSIYKHHMEKVFGNRPIETIPTEDYNEFLRKMYQMGDGNGLKLNGYSFQYVQSILKFVFLVENYGYQKHIITTDHFMRFKEELKMPERKKRSDQKKIRVLTEKQIIEISELLKYTDFYIPFLISLTGGLRPAETFALCFEDIDFDNCTVSINKQIVEETTGKRIIKQPKTPKSNRTIELPLDTITAIWEKKRALQDAREDNPLLFEQNKAKFIDGRNYTEKIIEQLDFINVDLRGRYVSAHSFSYYTKIIKRDICPNIPDTEDFSFYTFRKTHLSQMAGNNCPVGELMKRAGHGKIDTLYEYYYNTTSASHKALKDAMYLSSATLFKK